MNSFENSLINLTIYLMKIVGFSRNQVEPGTGKI